MEWGNYDIRLSGMWSQLYKAKCIGWRITKTAKNLSFYF